MNLKEAFRQFFKSVNPARYHHISEKQLNHSFKLFFLMFFLAFVLTFIFSFPVLAGKATELSNSLQGIPDATFNISVKTNDPVIVLHSPEIIIDSNASGLGSADILFAENTYYYNVLGEHNESYNYSGSVSEIQPKLFRTVFLLFIPGVLLLFGLSMIILFVLSVVLAALIAYAFVNSRLSFRDVMVVGLHAMLLPMVLFMIVIPFFNLGLLCSGIFVLLFILGVIQANAKKKGGKYSSMDPDEQATRKSKRKSSKKRSSKPRQMEIWD